MSAQTGQHPETPTQTSPTLVLGLGNILLRDEGVGVRVVQAAEQRTRPPGVELFDGATAGLDLLDVLAHREKVIVIDAIDGACAPGTVLRLRADDLVSDHRESISLHEIGFLETLTIARQLGIAPKEVIIIGVQPHEVSCGLDLSPEMARRVPKIIELIWQELEQDGLRPSGREPEKED